MVGLKFVSEALLSVGALAIAWRDGSWVRVYDGSQSDFCSKAGFGSSCILWVETCLSIF